MAFFAPKCSPPKLLPMDIFTELRMCMSHHVPPADPKLRKQAFGVEGDTSYEELIFNEKTPPVIVDGKEQVRDPRADAESTRKSNIQTRLYGMISGVVKSTLGVSKEFSYLTDEEKQKVHNVVEATQAVAWMEAVNSISDIATVFRYAEYVPQLAAVHINPDEEKKAASAVSATLVDRVPDHMLWPSVPEIYSGTVSACIGIDRWWRNFPVGAFVKYNVKTTNYTGSGGMVMAYDQLHYLAKKTPEAVHIAQVTIYPTMKTGYVMPMQTQTTQPALTNQPPVALVMGPGAIPANFARADKEGRFAPDPAAKNQSIECVSYKDSMSYTYPGCVSNTDLEVWLPANKEQQLRLADPIKMATKSESIMTAGTSLSQVATYTVVNIHEKHAVAGKDYDCYRVYAETIQDNKPPGYTEAVRCLSVPGCLIFDEMTMYPMAGMRTVMQKEALEFGQLSNEEMDKLKAETNMVY